MTDKSQWEDDRLLFALREGDHHAFAVLVRRHSERFYRLAYRFTAQRAEAEDVVQECFLKLWERPHLWQPGKARFTTWFYRIIVNRCYDLARKPHAQQLPEMFEQADTQPGQEEAALQKESQMQLEAAIRALPDRQQAALNLCFYEGVSNREAATVLGIGVKALESLLMRAKTSLRAQLSEEEGEDVRQTA